MVDKPSIEPVRIRPTIEPDVDGKVSVLEPFLLPPDDFRIRLSHEQTAKEWRSDFAVELTGNLAAMGYEEIKNRLAALSVIAAQRQSMERAVLNHRDGFTEELEFKDGHKTEGKE